MTQQEAAAEIEWLAQLVKGCQNEEHMQRTYYRATEAILRSFSDKPNTLFKGHEETLARYFKE